MRLLIACADRPGIVAAVASFLYERGANITSSDQHSSDPAGGRFFMRMEFTPAPGGPSLEALREAFAEQVAAPLAMEWRLTDPAEPRRVALLASRQDHCLLDLLWRWRRGELHCEIVGVISNHRDVEPEVDRFGVPFLHVPVTPETKPAAEARMLQELAGRCDLVVLARYMQILSGDFLARVGAQVINIHHSFLPAFAGPDPYRRARDRGVKIIGATAHYVTEELDAGPIIEQDVIRISHRATVEDLTHAGADIERLVLARAIQWHLQDRVVVDGNTTVVFA